MSQKSDGRTEVVSEPFRSLVTYWNNRKIPLVWSCFFVLPVWLSLWMKSFGMDLNPQVRVVKKGGSVIGLAPLLVHEGSARLVSDPELFDYVDFICAEGEEKLFFSALAAALRKESVTCLDMGTVRGDSPFVRLLKKEASRLGCVAEIEPAGNIYELELPGTWEEYLAMLSRKGRHEIRRKLRRLNSAGNVTFRAADETAEVKRAMDTFIDLFRRNKREKALFMSEEMESFFRSLGEALAEARLLRLYVLNVNAVPVSAAMCFFYGSTVYLYNSGYDIQHRGLSAGILCKVLSIRDSILRGMRKYDFLKGEEPYKQQLGGSPVQLWRCRVILK